MLLTITTIEGWFYVVVQGRAERFGFSTETAAKRRMEQVLNGWI